MSHHRLDTVDACSFHRRRPRRLLTLTSAGCSSRLVTYIGSFAFKFLIYFTDKKSLVLCFSLGGIATINRDCVGANDTQHGAFFYVRDESDVKEPLRMSSIPKQVLGATLILVGIMGVGGCASKEADIAALKRLLAVKQARIDELKLTRADMQRVIDLKNAELDRQKNSRMQASHNSGMVNAAIDDHGIGTAASRVQAESGEVVWTSISCQLNASPEMVRQIQRALQQAYYYHGALDGVYGPQTRRAIGSYQRAKGLAVGGMTIETLRSLGLEVLDKPVVAGTK